MRRIARTVDPTIDRYSYYYIPDGARDGSRVVNADELVTGGGGVEVGLLLVYEERVRHPYVLDEL